MANSTDKCKQCGGDYGLHHYQTNQCPVGGREAPPGRAQEWMSMTFQRIDFVHDAAPEMLAALEALQEAFVKGELAFTKRRRADSDPYHPANTLMSKALAKARGD